MTASAWWWLGLAIFSGVTVIVAVLLGFIIAGVRTLNWNAARIWVAGKAIAGNTVSIWMLERTNDALDAMQEQLERLESQLREAA